MHARPSPLARTYDLSQRPRRYSERADAAAALLADVAGWPPPPVRTGREVTIARLTLGGTGELGRLAPTRIEIRARWRDTYYAYRIHDDLGRRFRPFHSVSSLPLCMGQLCEIIDESEIECADGGEAAEERGLVLPALEQVFGFASGRRDGRQETAGSRSALVDAARAFVRVESELYPGLARYYDEVIDEWLVRRDFLPKRNAPAGCDQLESAGRARREPAPSPVPPTCSVAGPHAAAIERIVRAWWRSQEVPLTADAALDVARDASRLRAALKAYAARRGRLPRGAFEVMGGARGWTVDLRELRSDI